MIDAKGIDYEKTCAHVACLEAIQLLLAFAFNLNFYQMDAKSAFLKEFINEKSMSLKIWILRTMKVLILFSN